MIPDWAPIALGVLLAAVNLLVLRWVRGRRARRMQAWAESHGWTWVGRDRHLDVGLDGLSILQDGNVHHLAVGTVDGHDANVLQHEYMTGGKDRRRIVHAVCTLAVPPGPGLSIRREHAGHRLLDALGKEDIDFESHEFSRRFWVQSPDRRFAYAVLHPRAMEYLLRHDRFLWEWRGGMLVVAVRTHLDPGVADELLTVARGFRRLVPRHLEASVS